MDTRSLRAFEALANTLHFGRAAAQCNLSPSALTRMVQRLEHELGCRLFDRSSRAVSLTPQGRLLLSRSEAVLGQLAALREGIREESSRLRGSVSLYCSVTASYSILSELLPDYRRRFPEVEIKVHTGDEAIAIRRVQQASEDLAIAARPDKLDSALRFTELVVTPLVFIAPVAMTTGAGLLATAGRQALRKALAATPLILPEAGLARSRVDRWLSRLGVAPPVYAQVSGNEAIAGMVALGFGCAFVPALVLRESPLRDRIRVLDLRPALPPFRIGLCCLARSLDKPLVRSLWDHAAARNKLG